MDQAGIIEIFGVLNNPEANNDDIHQVESILETLYSNPDTLFQLFEIFGTCAGNRGVQLQAMIGIGQMLTKEGAWDFYVSNSVSEGIKQQFIEILATCQDPVVLPTVCKALTGPLEKEYTVWPAYMELFSQFAGGQDKESVTKALLMLHEFLQYVEPEHLAGLWTPICEFAMHSLSIDDSDIISLAAEVVGKLFTHAQPDIEIFNTCLPDLLGAVIQRLAQFMSMEDATAYNLMTCCEYAGESDFEFDYGAVFEQLLLLAHNTDFPIDHRTYLFMAISNFAERAPELDSFVEHLAEAAFVVAFQAFNPDCSFDDQENMWMPMNIFEVLIRNSDPNVIYELIKAKFGSSEPELHVAYVMALLVVIERDPSVCVYDIKTHAVYGMQLVQEDIPIIQQTGFKLLAALFDKEKNPVFNEMTADFLTVVFACLRIENIPLIKDVLLCLWYFLNAVDVGSAMVDPIFTSLVEVLTSYPLMLQDTVVDCFTGLTLSAGEDIERVLDRLIPLLGEMLGLTDPEAAPLRGSALQCMSVIIRFCPLDTSIVGGVLGTCVECLESGDNVLIKSALMALKDIVKANRPEIEELVVPVLTVIHSILSTKPEFGNDEEADEENKITKNVWVNTLQLVKVFVKKIPEAIAPVVADVKQDIYMLINQDTEHGDEIMAEAFIAMTYLTILYPDDVGDVCECLIRNGLDEDHPDLAATCMECFTIMLEHIPIDDKKIIDAMTCVGFQSMTGEFECTDTNFVSEVYRFFATLATRYTEVFPLDDYLKAAKSIVKNGNPFEITEMIRPLAFCFSIAHEAIHAISKRFMVDLFVSQLDVCDMYFVPSPVAAIRAVAESEPDLLKKYMDRIFEFIDEKLCEEFDGQPCFDMTMDYIVSLLFSVFRITKEEFPVDKYMAKMLELLPTTSPCQSEAVNIYFSLCMIITEYPALMGNFAGEIVRILAQLLGSKECEWKEVNLPVEVAVLCANILLPTMEQGQAIIAAALNEDEQAGARLTARVTQLSALAAQ